MLKRRFFIPYKMEEKKDKNKKINLGGSYKFKIAKKYSKPKTKGDKHANRRKKK